MASAKARADIEDMLADKGVQAEFFEEFDTSLIDVAKSLANQARIGAPINAEQVQTYEEGMKRGDTFPAIIIYQQGKKYIVIDGNHRVAAAMNTGYKLGAYVVDAKKTPAQVIVMLTYEANTKHGLPTSQAERAKHAIYLVENANETIKNAAARMNLPLHFVSRYYGNYRADNRASQLGVPGPKWRELHVGSRARLNSILDDEVFKAAVDVAFKARLNSVEVDELVSRLRTLGSANEMLRSLENFTKDQAERLAQVATGEIRPRRARLGGPRQTLRSGIYMFESLVGDKRQILLDAMTPIEANEMRERLAKALRIVEDLQGELERKAKE